MKSENIVVDKSYSFALETILLYKDLVHKKKEFVLSKQILKSGTSIGVNIVEAIGGQSKRDFFAKVTIAYKEARETKYWLRLLRDSQYIEIDFSTKMISKVDELLRILGSIQKTTKSRINS